MAEKRACLKCGEAPKMRRNRETGRYQVYCSNPQCGNHAGWLCSPQGASCAWHRANHPQYKVDSIIRR